MIFFLYLILVLVGLSLFLWLAYRISKVSDAGALLCLFVLPAFYWSVKLWKDPRANLRTPAIANVLVNLIALPLLVLYSAHYATSQITAEVAPKENPQMASWCKEQNDSTYDPVLEICVEPTKADVQAQEQRDNVMGRLEKYLNQRGVTGELDRSATPEVNALRAKPEIADAASYHVLPITASQPPILMLLCLSKSACAHVSAKETKGGTIISMTKGRLLLLVTPDSIDDTILNKLKTAMSSFDPG